MERHCRERGRRHKNLTGGRVDMMFDNIVAVLGHVRVGRLRPLAVSSAERSAILPEVPTVAEQGFSGFKVNAWFGLMAPAGTLRAIVDRVAAVAGEAIRNTEISGRLVAEGAVVVGDQPKEFARFLEADAAKWARVARDGNIRVSE